MLMTDMARIRAAFERNATAVSLRPAVGQKTYITKVHIDNGLTCDIVEGPWRLTADLTSTCGGNEAGPTPGTLGRAALGSCLAISYMLWAARLGIPLAHVGVDVHADADARGLYGVDNVPAGYTNVCYVVSVTSPAPHEDILRVLDTAEAHSPYMDVFRREQALQRIVHLHIGEE
jgi:uncharacterized OsmC-like protein